MNPRLALPLCLWLLATAGFAQPGKAPAFVDSREECSALGGAWVGHGGWLSSCQAPWAREECLRLGAAWTPMAGAPAGGLCLAPVSPRATARQCTASGGNWGPAGSPMPFCRPGEARPAPVRAASDAKKLCDSQNDCTYGCVYEGPPVSDGAKVMGQCRATNANDGCYAMVEKGRLAGRVCLK